MGAPLYQISTPLFHHTSYRHHPPPSSSTHFSSNKIISNHISDLSSIHIQFNIYLYYPIILSSHPLHPLPPQITLIPLFSPLRLTSSSPSTQLLSSSFLSILHSYQIIHSLIFTFTEFFLLFLSRRSELGR